MGDLTKNFSRNEFACKCGCGKDDVDIKLVVRIQSIRDEIQGPIIINSGVRCEDHNRAVGGSENSSHLTGKAADLLCDTSNLRYKMLFDVPGFFDRFGIGGEFIHVDIAVEKDQLVAWLY